MNAKRILLLGMLTVIGIMLAGCASTDSEKKESEKDSTGKKIMKRAVKSAIMHSPVTILKAVK